MTQMARDFMSGTRYATIRRERKKKTTRTDDAQVKHYRQNDIQIMATASNKIHFAHNFIQKLQAFIKRFYAKSKQKSSHLNSLKKKSHLSLSAHKSQVVADDLIENLIEFELRE